MRRALLAGACAAAALCLAPRPAGAVLGVGDTVFCMNCTSEWTDIANHLETMGRWIKQETHNLRQEIHNNRELMQLLETYRETVKIYNQAVVSYNAVTGVRDLGSAMYAMEVAGIQNPLPVEAFAVQDMLLGRGTVSGNVGRLFGTGLSSNRVFDTSDGTFRGDEMAANARSIAAIQAMSQEVYRANSDRLTKLNEMRARLRTASDPKEVQDLHAAMAAVQADATSQQAQLGSAHVMFVSAQAMRGQRSAEHEERCLRVIVAYFQNGGGSLNCPSTAGSGGTIAGGGGATTSGVGYTATATVSGDSDGKALGLMMSQSWGEAAVANAQRVGINPEALAATCAIESGCRNLQSSSSSAGGAFQVIDGTWREQATKVGVSTDLSGKADGATSSLVAANYLSEQGRKLQQYGIDTPTVGQARALYQFGGAGMGLATAPDSALVSNVMPGVSADTLKNNGITAGVTTAGQWRDRDRAKAGNAFDAPLFPASNT